MHWLNPPPPLDPGFQPSSDFLYHISGCCRPICARIRINRQPADSPSCAVVVRTPSGPSFTPTSCPLVEFPHNWKWTWQGLCHWRPLQLHQEILLMTRFEISTEPCFSIHLPGIYSCGSYRRANFLHCFWSRVGVLERLWKPCHSPRDEFSSWFSSRIHNSSHFFIVNCENSTITNKYQHHNFGKIPLQ